MGIDQIQRMHFPGNVHTWTAHCLFPAGDCKTCIAVRGRLSTRHLAGMSDFGSTEGSTGSHKWRNHQQSGIDSVRADTVCTE